MDDRYEIRSEVETDLLLADEDGFIGTCLVCDEPLRDEDTCYLKGGGIVCDGRHGGAR